MKGNGGTGAHLEQHRPRAEKPAPHDNNAGTMPATTAPMRAPGGPKPGQGKAALVAAARCIAAACLAALGLAALLPFAVSAAGMSRAWDPGFELRHNLDSHIYQYPSPYERVDTLSGRYNFMFTDVSLPGDGGLSLTIMHVW